nr:unnamed protein product [Callosobruchus chinensis]
MRVRSEHWQVILEFCEQNTELLGGKFNSSQGKAKANQLWLTLANRLNSLGFGEKSVESWRKALVDWKSKMKAKAATLKQAMEQTGGGPSIVPPLTDLEMRLINLMSPTFEGVPELGFVEVQCAWFIEKHCVFKANDTIKIVGEQHHTPQRDKCHTRDTDNQL